MAKYHINPKTGQPGICTAQSGNCPHGGEENHFPTKEKAREEIEKRLKSFEVPKGFSKAGSNNSKKSTPRRTKAVIQEEIKQLQDELKTLQKEVNSITNKIKRNNEKIKENKTTIQSLDKLQIPDELINNEKIRLTNENDDYKSENDKLAKKNEDKDKEIKVLREEIQSRSNEYDSLNKRAGQSTSSSGGCYTAPPLSCSVGPSSYGGRNITSLSCSSSSLSC